MADFWQKIKNSSFYVKSTNWEYYNVNIANVPTVFFWLYFGIRSRNLFFFSAVNPIIKTGGFIGASKFNILNHLPVSIIPKTILIEKNKHQVSAILQQMKVKEIDFPIVAKPDIGERGFLVAKIHNKEELQKYLDKIIVDFIIQDYVSSPVEVSVLYSRMPDVVEGEITSFCVKKHLAVIGDGTSTIETLMQNYPRARFQLKRFKKDFPNLLKEIPSKDKEVILEPIGNHCRGTTFLNGNHHIDRTLEKAFDKIALQMKGLHYGRFDIKCESIDLLKEGKAFKVLEFNGIASEPAHVFDPEYSVLQAYKDIFKHWKIIYQISKAQRKKGVRPMSWREAFQSIISYNVYMRTAKT